MPKLENRIREVRKAQGLTLEAVAKRAGTTNQQIQRLETGQRRLTIDWLERVAEALQCHPVALLGAWEADRITVTGSIGQNGEVRLFERERVDTQRLPLQSGALAGLIVRGNALLPRYGDGDVIFFTPGENKKPEIFLGNECVVRLQFGRHLLRRVIHGSRKTVFTLITHNALEMPDVVIEWAEPVRWVKRAVEAS